MSDEDYDHGFAEGYYQGLSTDKEKSFLILAARIDELKKENEKLRAALKPFALSEHKIERWFGMDIPDSYNVVSQWVTVGDLRAARAALKETE